MIPSWLLIGVVGFLVALGGGLLNSRDVRWFARLRRPDWLTFERLIPLIWTIIYICGAISAYLVWEAQPANRWFLMAFYLLVELTITAYTPVTCKLRSLKAGTIIGGTGFFIAIYQLENLDCFFRSNSLYLYLARTGAIKEVRNLLTTARTIPIGTTNPKVTKGNSRTNRAAVHGLLD